MMTRVAQVLFCDAKAQKMNKKIMIPPPTPSSMRHEEMNLRKWKVFDIEYAVIFDLHKLCQLQLIARPIE